MSREDRCVSPNELLEAAKEHMLQGREPASRYDWRLVLNFMAVNISAGLEVPACQLLANIYEMPFTPTEVEAIANFQAQQKQAAQ